MNVIDLGWWVEAGLVLWLLLLSIVVLWRILLRAERLQGLLVTRHDQSGSPGAVQMDRLQLLVVFMVAVGGYVLKVAESLDASTTALQAMPDVPESLLTLMAGSQAVYLSGKLARTLQP